MPKRRATSPVQPDSTQIKSVRQTEETGDVKRGTAKTSSARDDHGNRTPTRGTDHCSVSNAGINSKNEESARPSQTLSALAPEFVPRSASTSGTTSPVTVKGNVVPKLIQSELTFSNQPPTQSRQMSKDSEGSSSKSTIRPVFKSEPIQIKDSTFQARLFSLESPSQTPRILTYMRRHYPDFQHHMSGWRYLEVKPGMTGLEGEDAFEVQQGWDDDGEKRGGKAVVEVIEKMGLCDVVVVVSRRFGGTLLGPARFSHIADCTRAVCTAMYERERAAERASRVADLVAQLREWDTEVAELRLEIAALEPNKAKVETSTDEKGKPSTISVSLKPPDYTSVLDPPDVEKAERLLQARKKTVQSLKVALEKKRAKPNAEEIPSTLS